MPPTKKERGPRLGAQAFGHLAAAMAHEVRNPLNSMAIHSELLEMRIRKLGGAAADLEPLLKSVAAIGREVERIDGILDEYLDHVGPREASRRATRVETITRAAIDRAAHAAAAKDVSFAVEIAADVDAWNVDAPALAVALDAILANAVAASWAGGEVRVRAGRGHGGGVIEVVDAGEGMDEGTLARAFHLGFSTRDGHAGLGLAVAKQIVKGHGGSITATSAGKGRGATIRIDLPE